jgi:hypothetical protein
VVRGPEIRSRPVPAAGPVQAADMVQLIFNGYLKPFNTNRPPTPSARPTDHPASRIAGHTACSSSAREDHRLPANS